VELLMALEQGWAIVGNIGLGWNGTTAITLKFRAMATSIMTLGIAIPITTL